LFFCSVRSKRFAESVGRVIIHKVRHSPITRLPARNQSCALACCRWRACADAVSSSVVDSTVLLLLLCAVQFWPHCCSELLTFLLPSLCCYQVLSVVQYLHLRGIVHR
jgi:hypothetical protein